MLETFLMHMNFAHLVKISIKQRVRQREKRLCVVGECVDHGCESGWEGEDAVGDAANRVLTESV